MRVLSTVDSWLKLAALGDEQARISAWVGNYEPAHPSVFEVYYQEWGAPERRDEAARVAPTMIPRIQQAETRAINILATAERDFVTRGLLQSTDVRVVLMVGGHSSNGWVAEHQGRPTLFLALEYLSEPPYDDVLVVHELTHLIQGQLSPEARSSTVPTSFSVLLEGAAVATTRLLRPGLSPSAYLWMDDAHAEWIGACERAAQLTARLLLEHLDTPDGEESVSSLLCNREGGEIPPRAGYWAGDQIARTLLDQGRDIRSILAMNTREARQAVAQWARLQNPTPRI